MIMDENNKNIEQYIRDISLKVNSQYGKELINEDKIIRASDMFKNSTEDLETEIIPKIKQAVQKIINDYLEQKKILEQIPALQSFDPDALDTHLNNKNQGVYLSTLMVIALSLINCSSIEEINKWIDSVPNLYMISPIKDEKYSPEQIEELKKRLFIMYQDSMVSADAIKEIKTLEKDVEEDLKRYALHKRLISLHLPLEVELRLGDIGFSQGLSVLYKEVEKICIEKFGEKNGKDISQKIMNYFTTDYENFSSTTYEQMQALNEEIKSNIQRCNASGGNFQLVIGSLNYGNTVNKISDNNYEYNFESSRMGQELAEKLGASYRLGSIINRNTADEMISRGFTIKDREIVIQILRDSLTASLQSLNNTIGNDGINRTFELFNELVEINKPDRNYKCVWEDRFGITLEDMIRYVIVPNGQLIQQLKSKNVDFMYNETLLQESQQKRDKIMETMLELQKYAPGLITVWADQDHTFLQNYSEQGIEQLRAVAEFDKKMAEIIFKNDEDKRIISFTDKFEFKVKLECSETDLYLSQEETTKMKQDGMSKEDILKYKQVLLNIHNEIFKNVSFERKCEWTVIDNLSGDYYDQGMNTKEESYIGKYTRISSMVNTYNSQKVNRDLSNFNNWKQAISQIKQQTQGQSLQPKKQKPFDQRSQSEVNTYRMIKEKNAKIKTQKRMKNKPKVLLRKIPTTQSQATVPNGNKGYINVIMISLITSFAVVTLFVIIYLFLWK